MSKETPKGVTKKIASARKDSPGEVSSAKSGTSAFVSRKIKLLFGIGLVILGVGMLLFGLRGATMNREFIRTPKQLIEAEVVDTQLTRDKGLGGRNSLGANQGMLFVFEQEGLHHFWMKGMKFSLDIVWLSSQKKVLHLETNVSPDTYPEKIYTSPTPALYVLELPAGRAAELGIAKGVVLSW